jgi:hypothetical protein
MTDEAMSPLRRRMIEDMTVRNFAADTLRPVAGVGGFLRDELALASRQLGLVVQLVLRDGAFLLDRQRPALEHRLVGFLLQALEELFRAERQLRNSPEPSR